MASLTCPRCGSTNVQPAGQGQYVCQQCQAQLRAQRLPHSGASLPRCPHCKRIILEDALFCHACGETLQTLVPFAACPACQQGVPAGSRFCPYCRAEITPAGASEYECLDQASGQAAGRLRESDGCPACRRTIGPAAQVCRYCGINVEEFLVSLRQSPERLEQFDREFEREQRQHYVQPIEFSPFWIPAALMGLATLMLVSFGARIVLSLLGTSDLGSPSTYLGVPLVALFLFLLFGAGLFALAYRSKRG